MVQTASIVLVKAEVWKSKYQFVVEHMSVIAVPFSGEAEELENKIFFKRMIGNHSEADNFMTIDFKQYSQTWANDRLFLAIAILRSQL